MQAGSVADSHLRSGVEREVRPLLDLIDELRAMGIEQDLPLPQIAVMGDQSSGKSSVLEALSGIPFPRGTGLVTRCPCQLVMKRAKEWKGHIGVLRRDGETSDLGGPVSSVAELSAAIQRVTEALCGPGGQFSSDSIVVHIQASNVPDLTLVDLPGIVRTTTAGQDSAVLAEVNRMIEFYLEQERTIVLAIVPANQDVATVDILERAMAVDPAGERTIGVLTKPDLVGEGAEDEVVAVLKNQRKPLKLGYVMVKNRSAKEHRDGIVGGGETRYFREHETWSKLPSDLLGVETLTRKLTKLLTKRIQVVLPELKYELEELFKETEAKANEVGAPPPSSREERSKLVLRMFADYCAVLRQAQRGDYRQERLSQSEDLRLRGKADKIFRSLEDAISIQKPDFEAPDFTAKLHQELGALRGRELPGLLNSYFFYGFMARHVEMWRPLIEGAKSTLYDCSFLCASTLAQHLLHSYPSAVAAVRDQVAIYLDRSADEIVAKIEDVFKHESDPFISKNDLSDAILDVRFQRFEHALEAVMSNSDNAKSTKEEEEELGEQPVLPAGAPEGGGVASNEDAEERMKRLKMAESHADGVDEGAVVSNAEDARRKKKEELGDHPLKAHVLSSLGKWYMANHGVTSMSMVEDMRTVLIAYWGVAAKRITENTCMLLETHLLAALAEDLEKILLNYAQSADEDDGKDRIDALLAQDDDIRKLREGLKKKKERVANALNSLSRFAPNLVARKPRRDEEKEERRGGAAQNMQLIETFNFTSNGDNGGFVYWLGTSGKREKKFANPHDKGRLRITSSGLECGSESLLVARKRAPCWTRDAEDSWICVDLGRNRAFAPTHYTLCNGSDQPGFDLLAWNLEGFDPNRDQWIVLSSSSSEQVLPSPWGVNTFQCSSKNNKAFRYLRIRHAGLNSRGTRQLPICAWEFYGQLFSL